MKKLLTILTASVIAFNASATTDMVIANVNENAITLQELKDRITLSKLLIKRNLNSKEFDVLKTQALDQLINEELKRQFVKNNKISISNNELNQAIGLIEKQRKLKTDTLINSIPKQLRDTAKEQIKDSLYQQKIVQNKLLPSIVIDEDEVDRMLANVIAQNLLEEYTISQIIVESTNNSRKDEKKANSIYKKLTNGEDFLSTAKLFSDDQATKLKGGLLGTFTLNELNFNLKNTIASLDEGQFSKPVKKGNDWYIIKLDKTTKTQNLDLSNYTQFKYIKFTAKNLDDEQLKEINTLAKDINGYTDLKNYIQTLKTTYKFKVTKQDDWENAKKINKKSLDLLSKLKAGSFSKIKSNSLNNTEFVYLLDERTVHSKQIQNIRANIYNNLRNTVADRKVRQFLKSLKSKAFIEIR